MHIWKAEKTSFCLTKVTLIYFLCSQINENRENK